MKKTIALLLVLVMALSMVACGNKNTNTTTAPETTAPAPVAASALEILETIWAQFGDDEKFFAMGGDYETPVDNAPGAFNVANAENLTGMLLVPAENTAQIAEAASLFHAMNMNNFTCGVFKLTEGTDAKAFADAMHTAVSTNPWMCGFPEKMIIANIGGYVLVSFGVNDAMNPFETKLTAAYSVAEILYNEAIA